MNLRVDNCKFTNNYGTNTAFGGAISIDGD